MATRSKLRRPRSAATSWARCSVDKQRLRCLPMLCRLPVDPSRHREVAAKPPLPEKTYTSERIMKMQAGGTG